MKFTVTSSPHIRSRDNTGRIMLDVAVALLPAAAVGIFMFGFRALLVMLSSIGAALAGEGLLNLALGRPNTLKDGSALVTGLLLALSLPATVPYWLAALGSLFAVVFVKGIFGGLGQNPFNPALGARAFLMLVFPVYLVRFPGPGTALTVLGSRADLLDAASSATPLHPMQMPALPEASLADLFLGRVGGCIGEVSTLALLLGGGYLLARKVISIRIPAAYLGSVALVTLVFSKTDQPLLWMLYSLLGGGVMLGAFFMATDYSSSPVTPRGRLLYGMGCGVLTVFFRYYGLYPEGVTYAILLMNACVWLLERCTPPRRFGGGKP